MTDLILTTQTRFNLASKVDGSGFEITTACSGHHGHIKIGNVSLAFDDRNEFKDNGEGYEDPTVQLRPLADDPVRLNGESLDREDVAVMLMKALAADLGFTVIKGETKCDTQ